MKRDQRALYNQLELPKRKYVPRGDGSRVLDVRWTDENVTDFSMGRTVVRRTGRDE
jgi:hypothetical protein